MDDNRIPLIPWDSDTHFIIANEHGTINVELIEVIGQGGCGIAYKGIATGSKDSRSRKVCVIKECYPLEENLHAGLSYERLDTGEIRVTAVTGEVREAELARQGKNADYEVGICSRLYIGDDGDNIDNNPHIYQSDIFCKWGDSVYIMLDTEKGETLKTLLRSRGKFPMEEAVHYTRVLLSILKKYFQGETLYCHGDLKPENIWITDAGNDCAEGMVILDFGSVFCLDDYKCDVDGMSYEEIMQQADRITDNGGLGCSSDGYRNSMLIDFGEAKRRYMTTHDLGDAKSLLNALNRINASVDIYAALQVLFSLATGALYVPNGDMTLRALKKLIQADEAVLRWLLHIMNNNAEGRYVNILQVEEDIQVLERLMRKDADPRVLLDGLKKDKAADVEIDEILLARLK